MKPMLAKWLAGLLAGCLTISGAGCASSKSTRAATLKPKTDSRADFSQYRIATVLTFEPEPGETLEDGIGQRFADGIASRLRNDFGALFDEVRRGPPLQKDEELIVTGIIRTYRPGNRFARLMLAGVGSAGFEGELILKHGADGRVLLAASFDKLWAWGGITGASKGIGTMVDESEASAAATVAEAKGWKTSKKSATPK